MGNKYTRLKNQILTIFYLNCEFTGKKFLFKKFLDQKATVGSSTINLFVLVLFSTSLFPRRSFIPGVLGGRVMADDVRRDPDAVGRCPPYPRRPIGSSAPDTRFGKAPQLALLVLSPEHVGAILKGERIVNAPPSASPLAAWLTSGDPEDFQGTVRRLVRASPEPSLSEPH